MVVNELGTFYALYRTVESFSKGMGCHGRFFPDVIRRPRWPCEWSAGAFVVGAK